MLVKEEVQLDDCCDNSLHTTGMAISSVHCRLITFLFWFPNLINYFKTPDISGGVAWYEVITASALKLA